MLHSLHTCNTVNEDHFSSHKKLLAIKFSLDMCDALFFHIQKTKTANDRGLKNIFRNNMYWFVWIA